MRPEGRKEDLRSAEQRLIFPTACWRKYHTDRLPYPDPLLAAAAKMAREHGVYRTAKVLSLEYVKRKRLTMASHTSPRRTARLSTSPAAFVELLTPGTGAAHCLIELEGLRGKMRIQWKEALLPTAGLSVGLWESV